METNIKRTSNFCPSAQPEWAGSFVFGVVAGKAEKPQVIHLEKPLPVTDELLALAKPVTPTEIFRFAAPCAEKACIHFSGSNCLLVQRTVEKLSEVVDTLPSCRIRQNCRWWQQEGKAACMRCPQVITDNYNPSELIREVATPNQS